MKKDGNSNIRAKDPIDVTPAKAVIPVMPAEAGTEWRNH
jgi:hypothetical protein